MDTKEHNLNEIAGNETSQEESLNEKNQEKKKTYKDIPTEDDGYCD